MTQHIRPAPVRKRVRVTASAERAFAVFTGNMGAWWPTSHSIGTSPQVAVVVEPHVGGRWYERGADGSECDWGRVLAWEPPGRVVLAWQIDGAWRYNPELVTEVEVRFTADGADATIVELEHRHLERYGPLAAKMRDSFDSPGGWGGIIEGYATQAAA